MDVVDPRSETDDQSVVNRNNDVMPGICKKLPGQLHVYGVVENFWRDILKNGLITALQNFDGDTHCITSLARIQCAGSPRTQQAWQAGCQRTAPSAAKGQTSGLLLFAQETSASIPRAK